LRKNAVLEEGGSEVAGSKGGSPTRVRSEDTRSRLVAPDMRMVKGDIVRLAGRGGSQPAPALPCPTRCPWWG